MCDTLIQKDLPDKNKPKYVYKRVQKVGEGKYISPVMGELMKLDVWKKAPKRPKLEENRYVDLVDVLKRPYSKANYVSSSSYTSHHDGMWGSFKTKGDAVRADLINNFGKREGSTVVRFPTLVVKCEVKGTVHASQYHGYDTYLCEYLKIVEEVTTPKKV